MNEKKSSLAKFLRLGGFIMPYTEEEIKVFEDNFKNGFEKPESYQNPIEIIKRGKIKSIKIESLEFENKDENILSMAAREGNKLSDEVRMKMLSDKKNAKRNK